MSSALQLIIAAFFAKTAYNFFDDHRRKTAEREHKVGEQEVRHFKAASHENTVIHRETRHWQGRGWTIEVWPDLVISSSGRKVQIDRDGIDKVRVKRGLITWKLISNEERLLKLRGFSRAQALDLRGQLQILQARTQLEELTNWYSSLREEMKRAIEEQRWFPTERTERLVQTTPSLTLRELIKSLDLTERLTLFETEALSSLDLDLHQVVSVLNKEILENELVAQREFLNTIESSPLTREQAEAVICYDSRVLLAAAAGSGKTSVMIARAAYAVKKGFCDPSRILLLAFNRAAADELQQRIQTRFKIAGITSSGIRASTFHSLGLSAIGKGTGSKPRLASWLDSGNELGTVIEIVDDLRDTDPTFRYKWDLYRLLFARVSTDIDYSEFDGYDKDQRRRGFQTLRNETVKSHGERLIADFLFLNGIDYEYERLYEHDVSDEHHSQYRPDFYYPESGLWHEHWALGLEGKPPSAPGYENYMKSRAWKIKTHREFKTRLVESTWAEVVFGDGLSKLQKDLEAHGLVFDWNPDREIPNQWAKPMDHPELAKLVRTFMAHIKSNSLSLEQVSKKLGEATLKNTYFGSRSQLFLDIYWPIHEAWNQRLREQKSVDFEDMLLKAADLLEDGSADLGYDLILVDEFQDSSQARARMVQGLLTKPDRYLLAVGDDWQAINRFAGADISVMRNFESRFGETLKLALTITFRCPHGIAKVASTFIKRNPKQLKKVMRALTPSESRSIDVLAVPEVMRAFTPSESGSIDVLEAPDGLLAPILSEILRNSDGKRASVLILGRYNFLLPEVGYREFQGLDISFRTVHSSKGLEADYVIVLGLDNGYYGFPSAIIDDPVLQLAMPESESFPYAEERRLFYVALTRARKKVFLLTSRDTPSPFVVELLDNPDVDNNLSDDGHLEVCPQCKFGVLLNRTGPFGNFLACSRFPACNHTTKN